jgi:hypothetical protein
MNNIQNKTSNVQLIHIGESNIGYVLQLQQQYDSVGVQVGVRSGNYDIIGVLNQNVTARMIILWDNITTTFSFKSPTFNLNIELSDAGAYIFSETRTDFTLIASHPMRVNGTLKVTVDRVGSGEGCAASFDTNLSTTNVTLVLLSSSEQLIIFFIAFIH